MIEKLIVGRYMDLGTIVPHMNGAAVAGIQPMIPNIFHLGESELQSRAVSDHTLPAGYHPGIKDRIKGFAKNSAEVIGSKLHQQRTSAVVQAQSASKLHRNFTWLEWVGGFISEVPLIGNDVLTGPMSGCWIMRYMRNNVTCVGHVGSVDDSANALTLASKAAWNAFSVNAPIGSCTGFRPMNDWIGAPPAAHSHDTAHKFFALVTTTGEFYSISAYSARNKATRLRIAGVQRCPNSLPANGQI